jgi:hypothetical protein
MAAADGMCRPMSYQAFVFSNGSFVGTLSPVPMDSRTDGALSTFRLLDASRVQAEFARYTESDPLCCPSRISTVDYSVKGGELKAERVTARSASQRRP